MASEMFGIDEVHFNATHNKFLNAEESGPR